MKYKCVIIGVGDYFRKISPGLGDHFQIIQCVDIKDSPGCKLPHTAKYVKIENTSNDIRDVIKRNTEACFILTPNKFHTKYLLEVMSLNVPVFVEKPFAIDKEQLGRLESMLSSFPQVYFSDFYTDVRAAALLAFAGVLSRRDWQIEYLFHQNGSKNLSFLNGISSLGRVTKITAKLLEGEGSSRIIKHREWLSDPTQGGMLLDLMSHLIAIFYSIFPTEGINLKDCYLGIYYEGMELGTYRRWTSRSSRAESYARIKGVSDRGIEIDFEVGKYWNKNIRFFEIAGERGIAKIYFKPNHPFIIETKEAKQRIFLKGDCYRLVPLGFYDYLCKKSCKPHGFAVAKQTLETIFSIKDFGNKREIINRQKSHEIHEETQI